MNLHTIMIKYNEKNDKFCGKVTFLRKGLNLGLKAAKHLQNKNNTYNRGQK